jgi:hypothetical protein
MRLLWICSDSSQCANQKRPRKIIQRLSNSPHEQVRLSRLQCYLNGGYYPFLSASTVVKGMRDAKGLVTRETSLKPSKGGGTGPGHLKEPQPLELAREIFCQNALRGFKIIDEADLKTYCVLMPSGRANLAFKKLCLGTGGLACVLICSSQVRKI